MARLIIEGQEHLGGTIRVSGMKNAATPILAATLLTDEPCVIANVPRIVDVFKMLDLLKGLGAEVAWSGDHEVTVCARDVVSSSIDKKTVSSLRSSVLLIGPLLTRERDVTIPHPGGCIIGNRPLDSHLDGFRALHVTVEEERDSLHLSRTDLVGSDVTLPEFSVTATENVLLAATRARGTTTIRIAAAEPHVQDLCRFLSAMGARIEGSGTHTLIIHGVDRLHGARHAIIPDQIEVGTWAVAAAVVRGRVTIENVDPSHLHLILLKLRHAGVEWTMNGTSLIITPSNRLRAFRLQALPYPGFPTDLQAPFAVLATQAEGTSLIHDPLFEGRLGYAQELIKMGANAVVCDPHRVLISGPTPLYGQEITSFDLRAGATLILAGLVAKGQTIIHDAHIVDRGYEDIVGRLQSLGARIRREDDEP